MAHERPPLVLRPFHGWFHLWERIIPSLYRVVAVAAGTVITAALVVLVTRAHWLLVLVLAVVGWIALAIGQEHDERVVLDVDGEFLSLLRRHADPVLNRAGYVFKNASGPARASRDRSDTILYEIDDVPGPIGCIDLWIRRERTVGGRIEVSTDGGPLEWLLDSLGEPELAQRVTRTEDAAGDVAALVTAFQLVFPPG